MRKDYLKKLLVGTLILALTVGGLVGCGQATEAEEDVITIYAATSGGPKPFTYVDENDELVGHNIELIKAIFDKLPQYKLEIVKTDGPSIFSGLDSDRFQIGVNNYAKNAQRLEKYLFSDPMFRNRYVIVVSPDDDDLQFVTSLSELAGKNYVGGPSFNATIAVENYNNANPDKQINIMYTEEDLVMQLMGIESGKYEFLIMDKPMYEVYESEYGINVKALDLSDEASNSIMEEPFSFLVISKGQDQLLADVNEALKAVIDEGISTEINLKYFGEDYTP